MTAGTSTRGVGRGDVLACLTLAATATWLFRSHVTGRRLFIGDSDRLNTFLNVLTFQADAVGNGGLQWWDPLMFTGVNLSALPYTFPNPLTLGALLIDLPDLFWAAGIVSLSLYILTGWTAYAFIRESCGDAFCAWVGASLYVSSALAVLKIAQNDMSFAVLGHIPLAMLAVRRVRPERATWPFVGLVLVLTALFWFTFLQKAAYAVMLIGAFALYRSAVLRTLRPALAFGAALAAALAAAAPRLITVGRETALLSRVPIGFDPRQFTSVYEFQNIRSRELLRWFDDGIFGRFPSEAAALGNNINLHEGLLLGTSSLAAFLIIAGALRYRGQWGRLLRFRDEDAPFHVCVLAVVMALVLSHSGTYLLYLIFFRHDFTHARLVVAALLPLCSLVAILLRDWIPEDIRPGPRRAAAVIAAGLAALALLPTIDHLARRVLEPDRVALNESWMHLARITGDLLTRRRSTGAPVAPAAPVAGWTAPDSIRLHWKDGPGETAYAIEMRQDAGPFVPIGSTPPNVTTYVVKGLAPASTYAFTLRACNGPHCSAPTVPVVVVSFDPERPAMTAEELTDPPGLIWLSTRRLARLAWATVAFLVLLAVRASSRRLPTVAGAAGWCLGVLMVSDALAYANLHLNGKQTRHGDRFFRGNDLLMATPGDFRVPDGEVLTRLHRRLEPDRYRAVAVCDPRVFAAFCAPHVAHFWRLRLVDGYSSGIPARLASLPWPEGIVSLRAITFSSTEQLPWSLLTRLNVKHAVRVTPAWYANRGTGPDVEVVVSPLPVVPRIFLAAAIHPVGSVQEALRELFASEEPGRAPGIETRSVVEGLVSAPALVSGGRLRATLRPGRVSIDVEPADAPQFLVLNELYHPDWRAYAGTQRLGVYPTNVVMTGVLVPPGAARLELRFEPFVNTRTGALFTSIAVVLTGITAWRLARSDRRRFDSPVEAGRLGASR